jgi:hypothetical protein
MPTNRTRRERDRHHAAVTPEAVDLYKRGVALRAKGLEDTDAFKDIVHLLDLELRLKPWVPNPLLGIGDAPPDDVPKDFHHYWFEVRDMQRALDKAIAKAD